MLSGQVAGFCVMAGVVVVVVITSVVARAKKHILCYSYLYHTKFFNACFSNQGGKESKNYQKEQSRVDENKETYLSQ